jgi:hypothetical protein
MTLNISKSTATEYSFQLGKIPSASDIHAVDELRLNIFNINLPAISLNQGEMSWQGKHIQLHLGGMSFDPLNISFLVDSECRNWNILYKWLTYIADNKEKASMVADQYVTDASIVIFNNFNQSHTKVTFKNIWVQTIGEISFSIRDGESHIESSATFLYDRYEVSSQSGSVK